VRASFRASWGRSLTMPYRSATSVSRCDSWRSGSSRLERWSVQSCRLVGNCTRARSAPRWMNGQSNPTLWATKTLPVRCRPSSASASSGRGAPRRSARRMPCTRRGPTPCHGHFRRTSVDHSSQIAPFSTVTTATCRIRWRRTDSPEVSMSTTAKGGSGLLAPGDSFARSLVAGSTPPTIDGGCRGALREVRPRGSRRRCVRTP